jgi:hypothetical protein
MPNDNDGEDEERAEGLVRIGRCRLGWLQTFTAETISFEDHGDFVIVDSDDLLWLENIAGQLAKEFARYDDDTN